MATKTKTEYEFIRTKENLDALDRAEEILLDPPAHEECDARFIKKIDAGKYPVPIKLPKDEEAKVLTLVSYCLENHIEFKDADFYYFSFVCIERVKSGSFPKEIPAPYLKSLSFQELVDLQKVYLKKGIKLGSEMCLYMFCLQFAAPGSCVEEFDPYFKMAHKLGTEISDVIIQVRKCYKPEFKLD